LNHLGKPAHPMEVEFDDRLARPEFITQAPFYLGEYLVSLMIPMCIHVDQGHVPLETPMVLVDHEGTLLT
jgi:hypothetical protein